jgi:hypothetical protein
MAFKKRPRSEEDIDAMIALEKGTWGEVVSLKRYQVEQLSLNELFAKYAAIEANNIKNKLSQCVVVREIRVKFGEDDRRFGEYLATTILSEIPSHTITRMIRVADFFEDKPIDGIAWSSALALSEPRNATVALEVYNEFAGKGARPIDVIRRIEEMIGRQKSTTTNRADSDRDAVDSESCETDLADIPMARFIRPPASVVENVEAAALPKQKDFTIELPVDVKLNEPAMLHIKFSRNICTMSQVELDGMVETLFSIYSFFINKADRLRLWRGLIRREQN